MGKKCNNVRWEDLPDICNPRKKPSVDITSELETIKNVFQRKEKESNGYAAIKKIYELLKMEWGVL